MSVIPREISSCARIIRTTAPALVLLMILTGWDCHPLRRVATYHCGSCSSVTSRSLVVMIRLGDSHYNVDEANTNVDRRVKDISSWRVTRVFSVVTSYTESRLCRDALLHVKISRGSASSPRKGDLLTTRGCRTPSTTQPLTRTAHENVAVLCSLCVLRGWGFWTHGQQLGRHRRVVQSDVESIFNERRPKLVCRCPARSRFTRLYTCAPSELCFSLTLL